MDIIEFRDFCMSLPLVEETTPFNDDVLVYKVAGKMFTLCTITDFRLVSVKCEPDKVIELTEKYDEVGPAPHMSKVHWVSLDLQGDLPSGFVKERVKESYRLVIQGMTRKSREAVMAALSECGYEF